jgi:hypothetical protein
MHPSLVVPWTSCQQTRAELLAVLVGLDPARWGAPPARGSWTLAQQVDHLLRSEVGTSKMARAIIRGQFQDLSRPPEAPLHDSGLDHYPYGRLAAPEGLAPDAALRWNEAAPALEAAHRRFEEELGRFEGPDADRVAAPDPATAVWFTLGGWVRLQAWHEAHHLAQIRALLGAAAR